MENLPERNPVTESHNQEHWRQAKRFAKHVPTHELKDEAQKAREAGEILSPNVVSFNEAAGKKGPRFEKVPVDPEAEEQQARLYSVSDEGDVLPPDPKNIEILDEK